jgi:hypothetical protein
MREDATGGEVAPIIESEQGVEVKFRQGVIVTRGAWR